MPKSLFQPGVDLQLETDSGSSFKECSSAGRVRQMRQEHGWHDRTWQANRAPQAPCASELMHRPVQQHGRPHLLGSEGAFFLTAHLDHLDLPENPEPGWMHGWMYQRMDGRSAWWQVLGIPTLYQFLCMYAWTCLSSQEKIYLNTSIYYLLSPTFHYVSMSNISMQMTGDMTRVRTETCAA